MEVVRGVGETFYQRSVNKAIGDSASAAMLGPELILALRAMGDHFPQMQANRLTLIQARANIGELFRRAMEWPTERDDEHFGALRRHIVRDLALLTVESGPNQLAHETFVELLRNHLPGDIDPDHRLEPTVREALDLERDQLHLERDPLHLERDQLDHVRGDRRAIFAALTSAVGLDKSHCAPTVRCSDYPLWDPQYVNVVTSGIGPDEMSNMTEPTNWPKIFDGYWTQVISGPLLKGDPKSPYKWKTTHEKLDFTLNQYPQSPFVNLPALKPYAQVSVCLLTGQAETYDPTTDETRHVLEYQLSAPSDTSGGWCTNGVDSVYNFDTGFVSVTTSPSNCAILVQQKAIGFAYGVTPLISLLNTVTCFAWRTALEAATYQINGGVN